MRPGLLFPEQLLVTKRPRLFGVSHSVKEAEQRKVDDMTHDVDMFKVHWDDLW